TWGNHVNGSNTSLPGAGCAGSNGTPLLTAVGTPEIAHSVTYQVANAPATALSIAAVGFDNVTWGSVPRPLDLGVVGAPGCVLRIDAAVLEPGVTTASGVRSYLVAFPNTSSLIGAQLFSQYLLLDPPANAFDWTISNAVRTTLGGWY